MAKNETAEATVCLRPSSSSSALTDCVSHCTGGSKRRREREKREREREKEKRSDVEPSRNSSKTRKMPRLPKASRALFWFGLFIQSPDLSLTQLFRLEPATGCTER